MSGVDLEMKQNFKKKKFVTLNKCIVNDNLMIIRFLSVCLLHLLLTFKATSGDISISKDSNA